MSKCQNSSKRKQCVSTNHNFKTIGLNVQTSNIYLNNILYYLDLNIFLFRKLLQLLNIRPSENLLLFGSPDLDIDSNTIAFTTVHKYIHIFIDELHITFFSQYNIT
jgi:hypothetical protein